MRGSTIALLALLMVNMALGEAEQKSTTTQSTTTQSETSGWGSWASKGMEWVKQGVETAQNYAAGTTATVAPPGSESKDSDKDSDKSLLNRAGCALGNCAAAVATAAYQGVIEVANGYSESEAPKKLGEVKQAIMTELGSRMNQEELCKHLQDPIVTAALLVFLKPYPAATIAHTFINSEQGRALLGLDKAAGEKKEGITGQEGKVN